MKKLLAALLLLVALPLAAQTKKINIFNAIDAPGGTIGDVFMIGASNRVVTDVAFYWDVTNHNLGIGVTDINAESSGPYNSPNIVEIGPSTGGGAGSQPAVLILRGSVTGGNNPIGDIAFLNSSFTGGGTDRRMALIRAERIGVDNTGDLEFFTTAAGSIAERMRLDSLGDLGIGQVPTSNTRLSLTDITNGSQLAITGSTTGSNNGPKITLNTTGHIWDFGLGRGTSATDFVFYDSTASAKRMVIDSTGNVQVGAIAATYIPDAGDHQVTVKGATTYGVVELSQASADADATAIGTVNYDDPNISGADKRSVALLGATAGSTSANRGGKLSLWTKADGGVLTDRLLIDQAGQVTIGGTPAAFGMFSVTAASIPVASGQGQINAMASTAVAADIGGTLGLGGPSGQVTTPWLWGSVSGRSEASTYAGYLAFATANTAGSISEKMRITSGGHVGINKTPGAFDLDLNTLNFTGALYGGGTVWGQTGATYNQIFSPQAGGAIYLGGTGDPNSYYDNTEHVFRGKSGTGGALLGIQGDANGSVMGISTATELLTVAAAATSATVGNLLPAGAIVMAVTCRVTTVIPTATSFTLKSTTNGVVFTGAVSVAANSTDLGTTHWAATTSKLSTAAQTITLTITGSTPVNNTGRVRITVYYMLPAAPTS